MEEVYVDFLTVIVGAIVYVILGAIWYSPALFGKVWRKLKHVDKKPKLFPALIGEFIVALIISFFLSLLMGFLGATSTIDGIYVGLGVWLGFVATTHFGAVLWSKMSFKLYLIYVGFWFFGFGILGAILGA